MRFLSDEHLAAATAALKTSREVGELATGVQLCIANVVTNSPDGDLSYYIRIANDMVEMGRGVAEDADAQVTSSYDTAARLNRGEIGNQQALLMGKIRIKGSILTLVKHTALLNLVQSTASGLDVTY
jgi:hypothetical protein